MNELLITLASAVVILGGGALGWLVKTQIEQGQALAAITAQLKNNGGSTLKDAVDRIEWSVAVNGEKLNDHLVVAAADSALLKAHLQILH